MSVPVPAVEFVPLSWTQRRLLLELGEKRLDVLSSRMDAMEARSARAHYSAPFRKAHDEFMSLKVATDQLF